VTCSVGIYVFDEVEVLDFAGPFEVFSTASRVALRSGDGAPPPFAVTLIADVPRTVRARGGFPVVCSAGFSGHPALDVLLVPGGEVSAELERSAVSAWIRHAAGKAAVTASVCTGALLLGQAGLLRGRRATTHWEDLDELRRRFPDVIVEAGPPFIDEGDLVTSAGIAAGLDMSLHLVARLASTALALRTARQMDYAWRRAE
jgi:transcriptional regulator GlxA family with amidase domain